MPEARAAREREHFDRLALATGGHWWGNRTPAGRLRQDRRGDLLAAWLPAEPGERVLELGCGAGDFSRVLAALVQSGRELAVTAVDVSPLQVRLARRRCDGSGLRFLAADATALGFAPESFDAVVGNAVLHHLELGPALAEVRRILRPGGRIFFTEPNLRNPQVWLEKRVGWLGRRLEASEDETAFLRGRLAAAVAAAGFAEVAVAPFDFLHPATPERWIPWVRRAERWLERLPAVREIAGSLAVYARRPANGEAG